jgi:hypothetical protein
MDIHDQPAPTSGAATWPRLGRVTGLAGLATIVLPYLMFWLWVITVAVRLLRRNFRGVALPG